MPLYPWHTGNNSVSGGGGGGGGGAGQQGGGLQGTGNNSASNQQGVIITPGMPGWWPNSQSVQQVAQQQQAAQNASPIYDLVPSAPAPRPTEPGTLFAALDKMKDGKVILTGEHHLEYEEGTASRLFYGQLVRMSKEAEMCYAVDPTIRLSYRYFRELRMPLIVSAGEAEKPA